MTFIVNGLYSQCVTRSPLLFTPSAFYRVVPLHLSVDLIWPSTTLQYFEEIWIGTPTSPARYRPSQWNQYKDILIICRSSNIVEDWYYGFYNLVECSHLSLHIFFEALLNAQALTSVKIVAQNQKRLPVRDARSGLTLRSSRMTSVKLMILKRKKI